MNLFHDILNSATTPVLKHTLDNSTPGFGASHFRLGSKLTKIAVDEGEICRLEAPGIGATLLVGTMFGTIAIGDNYAQIGQEPSFYVVFPEEFPGQLRLIMGCGGSVIGLQGLTNILGDGIGVRDNIGLVLNHLVYGQMSAILKKTEKEYWEKEKLKTEKAIVFKPKIKGKKAAKKTPGPKPKRKYVRKQK